MSRVFSEHVVIKGNLYVNDSATILKDLTVKGTFSFIDLLLTGKLTVEGNALFKKNITVNGVSNLKGNVNMSSNLTVNGVSNLEGNVNMSSNLILNGKLKLEGTFITSTAEEINYLNGATSNIQDQIDSVKSGNLTIETNDDDYSDYPVLFIDDGTVYDSSNLTYNPSTQTLTATTFNGNLTGDVTGDVTGNLTGDVTGNLTGNTITVSSIVPPEGLDKWSQLGDDIDGDAADDNSGYRVSLSSDGTIVAIGAPYHDGNTGHVKVYEYVGTTWNQLGDDIDGDADDDLSGYSVSLSSDGYIVAIGAPFNNGNGTNSGHVRVYQRDETTTLGWTQLGGDIEGDDAYGYSGYSVSLSDDGNRMAIGNGNGSSSGHVRVYQRDETTTLGWTQLGGDIDGEAPPFLSGHSVSLSSDGYIVAIGASWHDGYTGHVRVYEYDSDNDEWTQLGGDIDGEAAGDNSGISVSLSSLGTIVAIGAYLNDGNTGHVRVYQRDETTTLGWTQLGGDIDGEAKGDYSGYSVSLSADGSRVAIGAYGNDDDTGHVKVYEYEGTQWTQVGEDIDGETAGDQSGIYVSLSGDGTIVAISTLHNDDNTGHVRMYELTESTITIDNAIVTGNLTGDVTGDVTGNLTGDVTGNLTGDVTGNLTGDVTGNLTGDVTGDVTGNLTGDVTGDVTGNLSGDVTGNVNGNLTGNVSGNVSGTASNVTIAELSETDNTLYNFTFSNGSDTLYESSNLEYDPSNNIIYVRSNDTTDADGEISAPSVSASAFSLGADGTIQVGHNDSAPSQSFIRQSVFRGGGPDREFGTSEYQADYISFVYTGAPVVDPHYNNVSTSYSIGIHKQIVPGGYYITQEDDGTYNYAQQQGTASGLGPIRFYGAVGNVMQYLLYGGVGNLQAAPGGYSFVYTFEDTSDVRLKDVLGSFDALDKIKNLNLVKYKYNDDCNECMCCHFKDNNIAIDRSTETTNELHQCIETSVHSQCEKENYGVIAQEVKDDFPDVIGYSSVKVPDTENEYYYTVKYTNFIPHLLKSVQELATLVEDLKTENATMKARLDVLENPTT